MAEASVLTELGPDRGALREDEREAVLFDIGVSALGRGSFQLNFCIRTGDADLIAFCRDHCGTNIFEKGSPVFGRLLESQPHRVIMTRLGRIEVYQPIGGEHTGGKSPEGPHTHLLPNLLSQNRTHSDGLPLASGWVPCAFLYSSTPLAIGLGDAHIMAAQGSRVDTSQTQVRT
jgi:hypothetical protein